jgi:hypothetical protein
MRLYLVNGDCKRGSLSIFHVRLRWLFLPHAIDPPACGAHAILQIKVSPGPIGGRKYRSLLILSQRDLLRGLVPAKQIASNRDVRCCCLDLRGLRLFKNSILTNVRVPRMLDSAPSSSFPSRSSDLITRSSVAALAVPASSFGHSPRGRGLCSGKLRIREGRIQNSPSQKSRTVAPLPGGQYAHFRVEFASVMPSHHPGSLSVAVTSLKLPRYIISSCSYQA